MNIRRFTMDEGMAALSGTIHSRIMPRMNGEDRRSTEPSRAIGTTLSFRAHRRSNDGLDDEEDLKSQGMLLTPPSARTSSRYLAAGSSLS
jgi:hypothetical protein